MEQSLPVDSVRSPDGSAAARAEESALLDGDGKRPWHIRWHVRRMPNGRLLALWIGKAGHKDYLEQLPPEVKDAFGRIHGWPWSEFHSSCFSHPPAPHPMLCSAVGFLGIGYLPADWFHPMSVWDNWQHLAHARLQWQELLPEWERLVGLPDAEIQRLLEGNGAA